MKKNNKETVGSASSRLSGKKHEAANPFEQMREQLTNYDSNMHECVETNKKVFPGDFYVVVLTKKERLMQNVLRGYFFARISCPTPDYDQTVYKYIAKDDNLDFLWVIPAADVVKFMLNNRELVLPEQYGLLEYALKFDDGSLMRLAKSLNGERRESVLLDT